VLEHLPDPIKAIQEALRIIKPGGKAVFVDNDLTMHIMTHPHIPELGELYHAYCQSREVEGGNPKIGRELPTLLKNGISQYLIRFGCSFVKGRAPSGTICALVLCSIETLLQLRR
jgi:ubiquinone/menaquinone biosynthesis C-methylase UbiE